MLSDEEKREYEELKSLLYTGTISQYGKRKLIEIIEKQSKEIEELKQIKLKLQEKNIPIETLLAEFERLEDLKDDLTTVYLNGVYDGEKKVEDKIKAKIEEQYDKKSKARLEMVYLYRYTIAVLQSLLGRK